MKTAYMVHPAGRILRLVPIRPDGALGLVLGNDEGSPAG